MTENLFFVVLYEVSNLDCVGVLHCNYTRTFWVYFYDGQIEAGFGSDVRRNRLVMTVDTEPVDVRGIAFASYENVVAQINLPRIRGKFCDVTTIFFMNESIY